MRFVRFTHRLEDQKQAKAFRKALVSLLQDGVDAYDRWAAEEDDLKDAQWDELRERWPSLFNAIDGAHGLYEHQHDEDPDVDPDELDTEFFLSLGFGFETRSEVAESIKIRGDLVWFSLSEEDLPEEDFMRILLDSAFEDSPFPRRPLVEETWVDDPDEVPDV